jgi:hypothetical protein
MAAWILIGAACAFFYWLSARVFYWLSARGSVSKKIKENTLKNAEALRREMEEAKRRGDEFLKELLPLRGENKRLLRENEALATRNKELETLMNLAIDPRRIQYSP